MQLVKGLFIAAVLCIAMVSAGNPHQQEQQEDEEEQNGNQYQVDSDSNSGSNTPAPVQKGFDVNQVTFTSSDPAEEKGEDATTNYVPYVAIVGACACVGVIGAVYFKRRNEEDKLPGDIFTIDDKNSVL